MENQKLDGDYDANTDITFPKKTKTITLKVTAANISKCPMCGWEYLMEHDDSSFKICGNCGHNWKE